MEKFVPSWIDGSVQPELLIVDPNHAFVDRDAIRVRTALGL
jgi:hypothetical protein